MREQRPSFGLRSASYRLPESLLPVSDLVAGGDLSRVESLGVGVDVLPVLGDRESVLDLAASAAVEAIDKAQLAPEDFDWLFFYSSSYHNLRTLNCSGYLKHCLGLRNAIALGIADAQCASVHMAMTLFEKLCRRDRTNAAALLVGADAFSQRVIPPGVLVSDGASAVVLQSGSSKNTNLATVIRSRARDEDNYHFDPKSGQIVMNTSVIGAGPAGSVYEQFAFVAHDCLELANVRAHEIDWFVSDSFSTLHSYRLAAEARVEEDRVFVGDISVRGHTGVSDIVISLVQLEDAGLVRPGRSIFLGSLGLGGTWAATLLQH